MAKYRISTLEFGYMDNVPADYVYDGFYGMGQTFYYPFCFTLIQGEGHHILFDTGFNKDDPKKYERFVTLSGGQNAHSSTEILETVGVRAEDIDVVILSHAHWDHAGATELFPNAKFYMQRDEYEGWKRFSEKVGCGWTSWLTTEQDDMEKLQKLLETNRLELLDGEVENFLPGIHIKVSKNGHSFAMQMLIIDSQDDSGADIRYILAGDAYNRPDSVFGAQVMHGGYVLAKRFNVGGAEAAIETMADIYSWAHGCSDHVVTTHDGSLVERFPNELSALGLHIFHICD